MIACNTPFAAKPSCDLLFIKLWPAALEMPAMEKSLLKTSKWPSLKPRALKNKILCWFEFLKKIKKICMEKVAGEQGLAIQQLFPQLYSKFFKNSN